MTDEKKAQKLRIGDFVMLSAAGKRKYPPSKNGEYVTGKIFHVHDNNGFFAVKWLGYWKVSRGDMIQSHKTGDLEKILEPSDEVPDPASLLEAMSQPCNIPFNPEEAEQNYVQAAGGKKITGKFERVDRKRWQNLVIKRIKEESAKMDIEARIASRFRLTDSEIIQICWEEFQKSGS